MTSQTPNEADRIEPRSNSLDVSVPEPTVAVRQTEDWYRFTTGRFLAVAIAAVYGVLMLSGALCSIFECSASGSSLMETTQQTIGTPLGIALGYYFAQRVGGGSGDE